jgi:hypothetical protein
MICWGSAYASLKERVEVFGVQVKAERLGFETTGVFDGLSITTNDAYDWETRCHNVAHAIGHIAQWSLEHDRFRTLYDELYAAQARKHEDVGPLDKAILRFREYEEEASQYAAWLWEVIGWPEALPSFTVFARADIEAIAGFHRHGIAPIWREFFADYQARIARGELVARPFQPKPIPPFTPRLIGKQEVIQEVDGKK